MAEARAQIGQHHGLAPDQVARTAQEIEEVEAAGARLALLVGGDQRAQLLAQAGGQVGVGRGHPRFQARLEGIALRDHGLPGQALGIPAAAPGEFPNFR